jgi:DNA polymerase II large subunit
VVNDGIAGRAHKVSTIVEKLGFQGWDWLRDFRSKSEKKSAGFMDDVIAGRPIFSFPSRRGGFRLRYGRSRNTGLSAVGIHPATMLVLEGFLAGGTQVRLELPGKGGVVVPVDTIEPPVVRLKDGSVVRVSIDNYRSLKGRVEKVLFLGDMLIGFGDFLYNSKSLVPSGYVEEWWAEDLRGALSEKFAGDFERSAAAISVSPELLKEYLHDPASVKPTLRESIRLSQALNISLHPSFTPFWSNLSSTEDVSLLRNWLLRAEALQENGSVRKIVGNLDVQIKKILETLCLPHLIVEGKMVLDGDEAEMLAFCLKHGASCDLDVSSAKTPLDAVIRLAGIRIKDKAPTFVGARMGRPEKAKRREMKPAVHVLFPVGLAGGSHRDFVEAAKHTHTYVEIVKRKCPECATLTSLVKCSTCGAETVAEKTCPRCGKVLKEDECPVCKVPARQYQKQLVNYRELLESASSRLGVSLPKVLKGVKGLMNDTKTPEIVEKGILRAKYDLSVYKDGTIRFDATNAPLTHFKPAEIGVSVEKLNELGYSSAMDGAPLTDENQVCELKIQDVIIPTSCADYFIRVAGFLDELLAKVYKASPYYRVKQQSDLIGHLIVGLAPHTCAGILGRIIGFTDLSICYAHPVWHSAKRRDCDGDEDTLMLALDSLLNFSREYLPAQIGGIMDAPLLLVPAVNTQEVQRQAYDVDVAEAYPIEFYEKTLEKVESRRVGSIIDLIGCRLGTEAQFEGFNFTIPVSNINMGNSESSYKRFKTMVEKLEGQLELAEKIEAVDARTVAVKVLTTHFIRDIAGNLRAFSTQGFRCKSCNRRFRRLPLRGKCPSCGGPLSLTVYRGGIEKYLGAAQKLVDQYHLHKYYAQRIALVKEEIATLFKDKVTKQVNLTDFA